MFKTKSAKPTPAEASATLRGTIEQAITVALANRVHKLDAADVLESQATRLRVAHSMSAA
jgi:hypothetical protein